MGAFWRTSLIFSRTVHRNELWFFFALQSVHQDVFWAIKQHSLIIFNFHFSKGDPFDLGGVWALLFKTVFKVFSWTLRHSPWIKMSGQKIPPFFIFSNLHTLALVVFLSGLGSILRVTKNTEGSKLKIIQMSSLISNSPF